jgi:hypothetical protein
MTMGLGLSQKRFASNLVDEHGGGSVALTISSPGLTYT